MATERRRQLALGVLLVAIGFVLYRVWTSTSAGPTPSSSGRGAAPRSARADAPAVTAPDVHLGALDAKRPMPRPAERNLFRFKPKPPPPPVAPVVLQPAPSVPTGPPPPPPIPLKFIGVVQVPQQLKRIAALVDPTGHPFHGAEGDVIAGQYRILKIGVESIEMAYLDGRGRQTIRLSGS